MSFLDEFAKVPTLRYTGSALFEYAQSLFPTVQFKKHRYQIVPENAYCAIAVQPRKNRIRFSVRGIPPEFTPQPDLPLKWGWGGSYGSLLREQPGAPSSRCDLRQGGGRPLPRRTQ